MLIACCTAIAYFKACLNYFQDVCFVTTGCMQYPLRMLNFVKTFLEMVFDVATSTFISNTVRIGSFAGFFFNAVK